MRDIADSKPADGGQPLASLARPVCSVGWIRAGGGCGSGAPGLRRAPVAIGGAVHVDGEFVCFGGGCGGVGSIFFRGDIVGRGQAVGEAVTELRDGFAEREQAGRDDGAGEVEGVAGVVDVAGEGGGGFSAEIERDGLEVEAVVRGRPRRRCGFAAARGWWRSWLGGLEDDVAERDGGLVGQCDGAAGEFELAGPGGGRSGKARG